MSYINAKQIIKALDEGAILRVHSPQAGRYQCDLYPVKGAPSKLQGTTLYEALYNLETQLIHGKDLCAHCNKGK